MSFFYVFMYFALRFLCLYVGLIVEFSGWRQVGGCFFLPGPISMGVMARNGRNTGKVVFAGRGIRIAAATSLNRCGGSVAAAEGDLCMNCLSGDKFTATLYVHAACGRAEHLLSGQVEDRLIAAGTRRYVAGDCRKAGGVSTGDGHGDVASGSTSFGIGAGNGEEDNAVRVAVGIAEGGDISVDSDVKSGVRFYGMRDRSFIVPGQGGEICHGRGVVIYVINEGVPSIPDSLPAECIRHRLDRCWIR